MYLNIDKEFETLIPQLTLEEYQQLEKNLVRDGCREPLVVWNGTIIDGHNRYKICRKREIEFQVKEMEFDDRQAAIEWIILNQFGRRNLPAFQRGALALRLKPIIQEKAKERQRTSTGGAMPQLVQKSAPAEKSKTRDELAKLAGVSHDTIEKVETIQKEGTPEQIERAKKGGKGNTVNAIYREIKKPNPNKPKSHRYVDIKGDPIKTSPEVDEKYRKYGKQIAESLIDTGQEVVYTVDDLAEEIQYMVNTFYRQSLGALKGHPELLQTSENRKKIMAVLSEAETAISSMKGEYLYE